MKVVTASQMRQIDKRCASEFGIPTIVLMENAGRAVATAALDMIKRVRASYIVVVAGKGNNGGDGFAAARHLLNMGASVEVFLVGKLEEMRGDARVNMEAFRKMGGNIVEVEEEGLSNLAHSLLIADLVVDAILGTGVRGEVKGIYREAIALINRAPAQVLSVDIPSGICADTGRVLGNAVQADCTVTFGLPKRGIVLLPGAEFAGQVLVADIGIPNVLLEDENIELEIIEGEEMGYIFPMRFSEAHKGNFGHVFILAGSQGFAGAATLATLGALRSGAGLVTLGVPRSLYGIVASKLTEAMTRSLPETEQGSLSLKGLEEMLDFSERCDVVALGPGLSTNSETVLLVQEFIKQCPRPMVIDADGLNALVGNPDIFNQAQSPIVITPHPGEMARLLDVGTAFVQEDRLAVAGKFAKDFNVTVVLKGARTVVAEPGGDIAINTTGNPGMASGGMGDVLTGMIASFIGQGLSGFDAARLGVYLHGLAGDIAAKKVGQASLLATDLLEALPEAMRGIAEGESEGEGEGA